MSTFEVKVYKLEIETHPNADALELAKVGEYRSAVRKGQFRTGDLGVYIPEASLLPSWVIKELGLEGKLAGPAKNRVKAMRIRGIVSQGLIYPVERHVPEKGISNALKFYGSTHGNEPNYHHLVVMEGTDVQSVLEIQKYEPVIPTKMAGEVENAFGHTIVYDIENYKRFPDVLQEGEEVVMTEKLHGTWTCIGHHPDIAIPIVTSKGLSAQGLILKHNDVNKDNLYLRMLEATRDSRGTLVDRGIALWSKFEPTPFYFLGETFGTGVQDLRYGQKDPIFRVFDVYLGTPGHGRYLNYNEIENVCAMVGLEMVPLVYRGPFSKAKLLEMTTGKELVSGAQTNIREGVVVKPIVERRDPLFGRVQLKSVSDDYLFRGGNATEFV